MLHGFSPGIVSQGASAYLIEQSLLGDGTSSYLNRTPSVAGNRKTWTWSCWFKGTPVSSSFISVEANDANGPQTDIAFQGGGDANKFEVYGYSASYDFRLLTSSLYRDSSAWYHIVVAMDTTQATASNRTKIYINGIQVTSFGTADYPTLNYDTGINALKEHFVMKGPGAGGWVNGAVSLPILVDGAALAPTDFGETDADGFWNPIEFTGATTVLPATLSTDQVPTLNSGSSGWDQSETFTDNPSAFGGWAAFDNNFTSGWITGSSATGWMEYQFASAKTITGYSLVCSGPANTETRAPKNWTIQGSNTGAFTGEEDTLATVTNQTSWGAGAGDATRRYFAIDTPGSYDYYRINVTANNGASTPALAILEMEYFEEETLLNSFGTNGFQLDFADTSDFGADVNYTGDTSVTFTDSSVNSSGATAYTFSSQAIGTASSDRVVAVGVSAGNSAAGVSTLTVGGVSAVKAIDATNNTETELWYASVPSGTTADIVVTFSSGKGRCGIGVWALTGVTGVGATNTSTSSTATLTVSGRTKDIVLAVYGGKDHASVSFSGVTENYDEDISGAGSQYQAGGSKKLTATGSNTITVTPNTGATEVAAVSAVFLATGNKGYLANNFTASDQLEDSPTSSSDDGIGNYCVWNSLTAAPNWVFSEGNLIADNATESNHRIAAGTLGVNSGKWYWEVKISNAPNVDSIGVISLDAMKDGVSAYLNSYGAGWGYSTSVGRWDAGGGWSSVAPAPPALTASGVIGIALDADANKLWFRNSSGWINSGDPATGSGANFTHSGSSRTFTPAFSKYNNAGEYILNCGQKAFTYTPPTGFLNWNTANVAAPTIADGSQYFNTVLYTGNGTAIGSGGNAITGVGFQPDFVWIKNRDATDAHRAFDSVRGATKYWEPDTNIVQVTNTETLTSFNSDGFTVGNEAGVNTSSEDYVAWCWKAGGAASSNTDGSITTSLSVNAEAGFSIATYSGNSTAGATLGHGLGAVPEWAIFKNMSAAGNNEEGEVYHVSVGNANAMELPNNNAEQSSQWNNTTPTSSVFTVGGGARVNQDTMVAYFWTPIEGFSKFGSYTGNGSADGPFVYTGFRPSFVMTKRTNSSGDWRMHDTTRVPYNPFDGYLRASTNEVELSGGDFDFLSNGFKIRNNGGEINASGGEFIYMAFAKHPFQGADGITQARAR